MNNGTELCREKGKGYENIRYNQNQQRVIRFAP